MTSPADLRVRAFAPVLYAHAVAEGNLAHLGMAEWVMTEDPGEPGTGHTVGYLNSLKTMNFGDYDNWLTAAFKLFPDAMTRARLEAIRAALFGPYGYIPNAQLQAGGQYRRGNSIALQGGHFCPTGSAEPFGFVDFTPVLTTIRGLYNGTIWVQIGEANHWLSFPGSLRFNNKYPCIARPAENPGRRYLGVEVYVNGDAFSVDANAWIHVDGRFPAADLSRGDLIYPATVYDFTHPTVVELIRDSAVAAVSGMGTNCRYMVEGEGGLSHRSGILAVLDPSRQQPPTTQCESLPLENVCINCEPVTHYSQRMVEGFRVWLQQVKGETLAQTNARWGTSHTSYDSIEPRTQITVAAGSSQAAIRYAFAVIPNALGDWLDYQKYLRKEIGAVCTIAAKEENPSAYVSKFSFGARGGEEAWLASDSATLGDWHQGDTREDYRANRKSWFDRKVAGLRLSGTRGGLAITSPPHGPASVADQSAIPPLLRAPYTYARNDLNWQLREAWSTGVLHVGYLRTIGFAMQGDPDTVEALLGGFEALAAIRTTHLEGFGPWQRYAIHTSEPDDTDLPKSNGSGWQAYELYDRLRQTHTPAAIFEDMRVGSRTLAQWQLKRSIVVVPWHDDAEDFVATYIDWFPAGAPGACIFVDDENPVRVVGSLASPSVATDFGALHRVIDSNGDETNVWVFLARDRRVCRDRDSYHERIADLLESAVRAQVEPHIASSSADPFVTTPLLVTGASDSVTLQVNSDGINWSVAVSNMVAAPVSVTLTVDPRIATALDVTYTPQVVNLLADETKFVLIQATSAGIDVAAAITDAQGALASLAGYDVTAVTALLTKAAALVGANPGRALALYIQACRLPVLRAVYANPNVTVSVRRLGLVAEAATLPITGARVQLVFPLNYGEEQVAEGVTNGSGDAVVTVGSPVVKRWDFATNAPATPGASARAYVEAHVTDLATGASARIGFTT